eukprot:3000238-Pyramimonas_sp.AAC.1
MRTISGYLDQMPPWTTLATCKSSCKANVDQCITSLRDSHGVLIRQPTETMANHRLLLALPERRRCAGHHQHAPVCNEELSMAAHYTSRMQSLFVDAVKIAHDLFQVNRDPFHGHP